MRDDEPTERVQPATLLYDGTCRFCVAGSARLVRLAARGAIVREDFHRPGVLERFHRVTRDECESAMRLVMPDGTIHVGAAAAVEAMATRTMLRWIRSVYRVSVVRVVADYIYMIIAKNRFRLMGRTASRCEAGSCSLK